MRRIAVAALLVLLLVPPGVVAATPLDGPKVIMIQDLHADFYIPTGDNSFLWLVLDARRRLDPISEEVLAEKAYVRRGTCEGPTPIEADCSSYGPKGRILTFEIADDFSHAEIVVRDRSYTHRLEFTARSPYVHLPTMYQGYECKAKADAFTEAWGARAYGVLYGHRVSTIAEPQGFAERMNERVYVEGCP